MRRALASGWSALALALGSSGASSQDALDPFLDIPEGGGPIDVGPTPDGLASVDAAACGACHVEAYGEWTRSKHRIAWTDPIFVREHSFGHNPVCARCHAPRPEARADGVDCAACHVRGGYVLNPTVSGRAPHASRVATELRGVLACGRCHEFDFERYDARQQSTLSEWTASASPRRGETCQTCHLRRAGRRHRHDLAGVDDPVALRSAVRITARARATAAGTRATFRLRARAVGHAVPTGDFFRSLVVRAWPEGRPRAAASAALSRGFRGDRIVDERLPPPPHPGRTITLELGRATRVRWTVELWLMRRGDAIDGGFAFAEARRTIARGVLEVEPPPRRPRQPPPVAGRGRADPASSGAGSRNGMMSSQRRVSRRGSR